MKKQIMKKNNIFSLIIFIIIMLIFIILILSIILIENHNKKECSKIELIEKNIDCPKLDCSTCPTKTEIKKEIKTITEKIYVCEDLTEVKNKDDCINFTKDGWYDIITITANSNKTSELFYIPGSTWRFSWKCESTAIYGDDDLSMITLSFYKEGDIPKYSNDVALNTAQGVLFNNCVNGETSYIYSGKNNYFLKISGANFKNLEVKVEAKN